MLTLTWNSDFDIEGSDGCGYDFVEIHDSFQESTMAANLLGRYCGSVAPQPATVQGPLYIWFHSDDSETGSGWTLNWSTGMRIYSIADVM